MAFTVTTDVFCDGEGCCSWIHGHTGARIERREAMKEAEKHGWRKIKTPRGDFKDYCPHCVKIARGLIK